MKKFLSAALLLSLSANAYLVTSPPAAAEEMAITTAAGPRYETVARVIDGDTFLIAANWSPYPLDWRIRVIGIDTPEKGYLAKCDREREKSAEATALATSLIEESLGRVRLKQVQHDKYGGRLDAEVILADGRSLGAELIKAGVARPYNGSGPKPNWCRP
jgi:micrococcal nuclease